MGSEIEARLRQAGLDVIESAVIHAPPSTREAFQVVVGFETVPSGKVAKRSGEAIQKIQDMWISRARANGIISGDDTFLVSGSIDGDWIKARLTPSFSLAALKDSQGDIEFIARSRSGDRICAVSTDEGDYWLIDEPFLRPKQRSWSRPEDVAPNTHTAQLLSFIDTYAAGTCNTQDFAHGWWGARRAAQAHGERVHGRLSELLDRVFMALEEYSVDPNLREPGDLTDHELRQAVRAIADHHGFKEAN
ncbi:colicin immunity domain-containing protein [Streptomyces sp. NPDC052225]|uniref:colicin immunity domain-containing protein n=1 Tax=Streptomyces sp. NPDC052225 TaxID=3154949 RepID=UPI00343EDB31